MLTINRNVGQKVRLYDAETRRLIAEISVVTRSNGQMRLAIDADTCTLIYREEIDPIRPKKKDTNENR